MFQADPKFIINGDLNRMSLWGDCHNQTTTQDAVFYTLDQSCKPGENITKCDLALMCLNFILNEVEFLQMAHNSSLF